jgi:hypothetical protein
VSKGKTRGKRRFVIWGLVISALIVIIIVYETNKELQRDDGSGGAVGVESGAVPVEKAQAILHGYYRSHDLPIGWDVGATDIAAPGQIEVTIYFAPRIGDSRHGKGAPPGDISAVNACPIDDEVTRQISRFALRILVHDKTGLIDNFVCR